MRYSRSVGLAVLMGALGALAAESLSSYIIYRHVAHKDDYFHPTGLATFSLLKLVSHKFGGGRKVEFSIDRGPLFHSDPTLGYATYPGAFEIHEQIDGQRHRFHVTIEESGARVTSYIPVHSSRHIFITGDSMMFGWGLNDEETIPWLLQARLPQYQVVNWALTSYSTVHALLHMKQAGAKILPDDIVILSYSQGSNELNVASGSRFRDFKDGLEAQTGEAELLSRVEFPFGAVDAQGRFAIRRVSMSCLPRAGDDDCGRGNEDPAAAIQVTEHVFDEIIGLHAGRVVVAFLGGPDSDPVISYLRAKGVTIADLRFSPSDPEVKDVIPTDTHGGAFFNHLVYRRLLAALKGNGLIE